MAVNQLDLVAAEVHMIRPTMDNLPTWRLPHGYQFRAYRDIDTRRPWAIKTYLDCGFVPDLAEREQQEAARGWMSVQRILRRPTTIRAGIKPIGSQPDGRNF